MTELTGGGSPFTGIIAVTKGEAAYLELRKRILEGTLAPGSTINQERLAADLGISITPLREGLRRLEAEELVTLSAHKIVTVAPLTWQELAELSVTREQLDPLAADLACREATDGELAAILGLAMPRPVADVSDRIRQHRAFHRAIYAASHNKVLAAILGQLWDRTDRYRMIILRDREFDHTTGTEHLKIATAMGERQPDEAAKLVRSHVEQSFQTVQRIGKRSLGPEGDDRIIIDDER